MTLYVNSIVNYFENDRGFIEFPVFGDLNELWVYAIDIDVWFTNGNKEREKNLYSVQKIFDSEWIYHDAVLNLL